MIFCALLIFCQHYYCTEAHLVYKLSRDFRWMLYRSVNFAPFALHNPPMTRVE